MVDIGLIDKLISGHTPPYVYNDKFVPGTNTVYYSGPYWDEKEVVAAVNAFLNDRWITSGENVKKFEFLFSKKFGCHGSTMVNSGSSANLVMMAALKKYYDWPDNSEIIVSPVGFPTTISSLYQNRLKPVFVDIEWDTLNFDINRIEAKIGKETKGIFVSPVLGNPPDMFRLKSICEAYDLVLIGDNCDSLGSKWAGEYLNTYYKAFSNSFYPAHHITTGEGGMVCTSNEEMRKLVYSMVNWGRACYCIGAANLLPDGTCGIRFSEWLDNYDGVVDHKYVFSNMGYNIKPLDLQGAIGVEQLKKVDEIHEKRVKSKETIEKIFISHIAGIRGVSSLSAASPSWFGTPFVCDSPGIKHRLVSFLEKNKIQTRNYFAGNILLHDGYSFLDDFKKYPEANKVLDKVFFVGASPHYGEAVFDYIKTVIKSF